MHTRALLFAGLLAAPLAAQQATFTPYGTGCYDATQSFYEVFNAGTFDLSSGGFTMLDTGAGYLVLQPLGSWHLPTGANLALGDDVVSAALPLGFTFPFPGGSTQNLFVGSNGFVFLAPSTSNGCCTGNAAGLLNEVPRIAAMWMDLFPPGGGSVVFDVDAVAQIAYVTFTGVPEFAVPGNLNTFQLAFFASGEVDVLYQTCNNQSHVALTGWSRGGGARDPGSRDLSTSLPFTTSTDLLPLLLSSAQRPVTGTTMGLVTSRIPGGTPLGSLIVSLTQFNPGLDLGAIGMPGCSQFVALDFSNIYLVTGGSASFALPIPNVATLAGLQLFCQSAAFSPGFNGLGVLASNGAALRVGTF